MTANYLTEMTMKKYIQTDTLQTQIDWENIMKMDRYAGGHDTQMQGLFKESKVIAHWNEGDYQGQVATCVQLNDGRFAIYNDYYGSCSGCDAWEDANDEQVRKLCIDLSNSAKVFTSLEDVIDYLSQEQKDDYSWGEWSQPLLELIKKENPGKPFSTAQVDGETHEYLEPVEKVEHTKGPWEIRYLIGTDIEVRGPEYGQICKLSGLSHSIELMDEYGRTD